MNLKEYRIGLKESMPIGIGYFAVSFGFGAMASSYGLSVFISTLISFTNLTSAGQFAGLTVIKDSGPIIYIIITQLVINSRYALMSMALSQKLGPSFGILPRLVSAFFNTDEIFALAMRRQNKLTVSYMFGLAPLPLAGWTLGTLCGAVAGSILPQSISTSLSVALYGMFIAVVIPQVKESRPMRFCALIACVLSCAFAYLPLLKGVSSGISIVICSIISAGICAVFFPVEQTEETDE